MPVNHVHGDSSSNYDEASIFEEDDEEVSSFEKDEDSDKVSRRSLSMATVQDHGLNNVTILAAKC